MSTALLEMMARIKGGLDRRSATTVSKWSTSYVRIPDPRTKELLPLSFKYHPWSLAIADCNGSWVSPKAAQLALTNLALCRALFLVDAKKTNVIYYLPKARPDAYDFSKGRFDPLIKDSPHLASIFTEVNNVGHKQAGSAALYIRGMRSMSGAKSVPAGTVIFDEFDEMPEDIVAQAEKRIDGQFTKQIIKFSTPTVPNKRIDLAYQISTKENYFFPCPRCGRFTALNFPEALVVYADSPTDRAGLSKSHYKCEYGCRISHEEKFGNEVNGQFIGGLFEKAFWQSTANADAEVRGFYINQFYSFTKTPAEIAKDAILAEADPAKEQEYHNSVGGKPVIPRGAGLIPDQLNELKGIYDSAELIPAPGRIVTMGVDIGKVIHFVLVLWTVPYEPGADVNTAATAHLLLAGTVDEFEELDGLMREWQVRYCVVDANPERRKAQEFANRFPGYVSMCLYLKGISGKTISNNADQNLISVDRTTWLDTTLGRFHTKRITLPRNISKEYVSHLCAQIKRYGTDTTGNTVAKYINIGADHFGHAQNYAEIALPMAVSLLESRELKEFL